MRQSAEKPSLAMRIAECPHDDAKMPQIGKKPKCFHAGGNRVQPAGQMLMMTLAMPRCPGMCPHLQREAVKETAQCRYPFLRRLSDKCPSRSGLHLDLHDDRAHRHYRSNEQALYAALVAKHATCCRRLDNVSIQCPFAEKFNGLSTEHECTMPR